MAHPLMVAQPNNAPLKDAPCNVALSNGADPKGAPRKGAPRKDASGNDATFQRAPLTGWYSPLLSMANPILTQFGSLGSPWGTYFGGLGPPWGHLGAALGKGIHAKTLFCPFLVANGTPMDTQKSSLKPQPDHLSLQKRV